MTDYVAFYFTESTDSKTDLGKLYAEKTAEVEALSKNSAFRNFELLSRDVSISRSYNSSYDNSKFDVTMSYSVIFDSSYEAVSEIYKNINKFGNITVSTSERLRCEK